MLIVALWALLSIVVAFCARARGRRPWTWLCIALVLSPLLAYALLAMMKNLAGQPPAQRPLRLRDRIRNSRSYRLVRNLLIGLGFALLIMVILNRMGMKPVAIACSHERYGLVGMTQA